MESSPNKLAPPATPNYKSVFKQKALEASRKRQATADAVIRAEAELENNLRSPSPENTQCRPQREEINANSAPNSTDKVNQLKTSYQAAGLGEEAAARETRLDVRESLAVEQEASEERNKIELQNAQSSLKANHQGFVKRFSRYIPSIHHC